MNRTQEFFFRAFEWLCCPFNCEWLCRRSVAALELSELIEANKETVTDLLDLKNAESKFQGLTEYLSQVSECK